MARFPPAPAPAHAKVPLCRTHSPTRTVCPGAVRELEVGAAAFRASLGLLSGLARSLGGGAGWVLLGAVRVWAREAPGLCWFVSLGEDVSV